MSVIRDCVALSCDYSLFLLVFSECDSSDIYSVKVKIAGGNDIPTQKLLSDALEELLQRFRNKEEKSMHDVIYRWHFMGRSKLEMEIDCEN